MRKKNTHCNSSGRKFGKTNLRLKKPERKEDLNEKMKEKRGREKMTVQSAWRYIQTHQITAI
jgi:hypothetical protein